MKQGLRQVRGITVTESQYYRIVEAQRVCDEKKQKAFEEYSDKLDQLQNELDNEWKRICEEGVAS